MSVRKNFSLYPLILTDIVANHVIFNKKRKERNIIKSDNFWELAWNKLLKKIYNRNK